MAMNLRETNSTLLFLSKVAEICFMVAIVFAFISLLRTLLTLKDVEL